MIGCSELEVFKPWAYGSPPFLFFSAVFTVREFSQCNWWGSCGAKDKLESLELLNSSGVTPAGLSHLFPLSFLHATESFLSRVQHLGEDFVPHLQCLVQGIWRHLSLCCSGHVSPKLTLTGLTPLKHTLAQRLYRMRKLLTSHCPNQCSSLGPSDCGKNTCFLTGLFSVPGDKSILAICP